MFHSFSRAAAAAVVALAASAASAATISTWNVGSGQDKDNFQLNSSAPGDLGVAGIVEIGLRAQLRTAGSIVPSGDNYSVLPGTQPGNPARVRWNFDYHVYAEDGLANLAALTLEITSTNANQPTAASFNLLALNINDADTAAGQDHAHYMQDSQNPVFAPWFASFNADLPGTYTFKLTATGATARPGAEFAPILVESMTVTVVPLPAAAWMGISLLGSVGGFGFLRKRARLA